MNIYEKELQGFRPDDEIQFTKKAYNLPEYNFVETAQHGYLIVPLDDKNADVADEILANSGFGYKGDYAYYLEEDCEYQDFKKAIGK